jgi:polyferredoxin/Fe-S-cluster-containing hydrogenase component 2
MKKVRIALSIILFSLITLYFLDFADILPKRLHGLAQIQLIPALLALNIVVLISILLVTLLFGRIYCSSLCPMGIFQDVADWMAKRFNRKKKYPHFKENKILRWSIVGLVVLAFLGGFQIILSLLDPYSAYGRMVTNIFKPAYLEINNLIALVSNHYNNFRFYAVDIFIAGVSSLVVASLTFLIIGFLSFKYGRLYCNTICPVGTVLGFVARFSVFKIKVGGKNCNSCGLCEMKCKASCIDAKTKEIDYSRCVTCFNCLDVCKRDALSYQFSGLFPKKGDLILEKETITLEANSLDSTKRKLLFAFLGLAAFRKAFAEKDTTSKKINEIFTSHNVPFKRTHPITPPGSVDIKRFNDSCTACHLCISKCPSQVLQPAFLEYGIIGMMQPTMSYKHGFCNYHCTLCTDICPTKALVAMTEKEKKASQIGKVHFIKENCVVVTDGTNCGACSEHCPTQAVSMQPYKGDLSIPTINYDLCIGCGGCEYICPVRPYRAIHVDGNPIHLLAKVVVEKAQKKIKVEDFGF